MNPKLKALINTANDGMSDALTLKPDTLAAILKELERMCHSSDTISCEPVANGGPGFKIKLRNGIATGTTASIYQMAWDETTNSEFLDKWDTTIESGGNDTAFVALRPTYDSAAWKGIRAVKLSDVLSFTSSGVNVYVRTMAMFTRDIVVNSIGVVCRISEERRLWPLTDFTCLVAGP